MKNIPIIVVAVILLIGVAYFFTKAAPESPPMTANVTPTTPSEFVADKTFDIKGQNYSFDVKEIKVKLNDKVKINFTNVEGMHDFVLDEFNVATPVIQGGVTNSVEFIANKTGSFQYYCSVGQHRANGMWGTLIVE